MLCIICTLPQRGGGGGSSVNVQYGIAEQQETGVGTRVYLRVHEAEK